MSPTDPESQLINEDPKAVHREHSGALTGMPWWLPMWVPTAMVCGLSAIAAGVYLVLTNPFGP
jgi:hypothetical protein